MGKLTAFSDMAAYLRVLFETESYSKSTIKDMKFILNAFADYMIANGLDAYTPKLDAFETFTAGLIPQVEVPYEKE